MSLRGPFRVVVRDLRGNGLHFFMASIGIILGAGGFVFLLALGLGVRALVVDQINPMGFVEFAPRDTHIDLWALRVGLGDDKLDTADIDRIAAVDGVRSVWPRMRLAAPAVATGGESLLGSGLRTEILGDGLAPELVNLELGEGAGFAEPVTSKQQQPCFNDNNCEKPLYCGWLDGSSICRPKIPVVVSPTLVDLFNGPFRQAYGLPELNPDVAIGLTIDVVFGGSTIRPGQARDVAYERLELVGFSDWAMPFGVSLPIGKMGEINARITGAEANQYASVIVDLVDRQDLGAVVHALDQQGLEPVSSSAERAASLLGTLMVVVAAAGIGVVAIAAINIMHVFLMHVIVRTREICLMRAVGARRSHIMVIIIAEAAIVGAFAGIAGIVCALGMGHIADLLASKILPDLPFSASSYFDFAPWLLASGFGLSVLACVSGALLPALRATRMDPSVGNRT